MSRTRRLPRPGLAILVVCLSQAALIAQVPDAAAPAPASKPAPAPATGGGGAAPGGDGSKFLGKDVPSFDPGSEMLSWDGKNWNISNQRVFQARFEKYLSAPEETGEADRKYQEVIHAILDKLAPGSATTQNIDDAFRLLPQASAYDIDARLCDALADAVFSAWRAQRQSGRLAKAIDGLEQERKNQEWNARVAAEGTNINGMPPSKEAAEQWAKDQQAKRDAKLLPYAQRLADVNALIKTNQLKKELSELQVKVEFQSLIVQFFLQRRYQHVLMATRFYRVVFGDGDTQLRINNDSKSLFSNFGGLPPTVGTLDSVANEAIRDVREGIDAYQFLLSKNELESATKRLGEAFIIGEYMPEVRTLPREQKRRALEFQQATNQLISAIDVKDYALAEKIVNQLESTAKDFDNSKPMAAIETARTVSAMHLAQARNAAVSGDRATVEAELKAATEIWPRNPDLKEVSQKIFNGADVQQQAIVDLDRLLSQKNYRQIFDDKVRFIAATALYPDRQDQLKKVLDDMQTIEGAIIRSTEIERRGDHAGAWENAERVFQQFPEDSKLNQLRANLTTRAADFVHTVKTAEELEEKDQVGSSLAWYLKAQKMYPASEFAREGIDRLVKKVVPDA